MTTDRYDQVKDGVGSQVGRSRLWRLTFDDVEKPWLGGTIKAVLDGTEAGQMYDNLLGRDSVLHLDGNIPAALSKPSGRWTMAKQGKAAPMGYASRIIRSCNPAASPIP